MPGVKIGDGAILGSESFITKNVAPYIINSWWNWDIEKITNHLDLFTSGNIEALRKMNNGV